MTGEQGTAPAMDPALRAAAEAAPGFMPPAEGLALYEAACQAARVGPLLEVGTYQGKSTLYLAAAARLAGTIVVSVDHHRGSPEQQAGWPYHDPALVDPAVGRMDTLPSLRRTLALAGVEDVVVVVVADSATAARLWATPLGMVFVDGDHSERAARRDFDAWAPWLSPGGSLAVHDVFPDPADGGQGPWRMWRHAVESGQFTEVRATGSLRVSHRAGAGARAALGSHFRAVGDHGESDEQRRQ